MKSVPDPADAIDMLHADPSLTLTFTAILAAGTVLVALKSMAVEMDYARRWHALQREVRVLRAKQAERLRNIQSRRR